jgi:superfamily II DNA or RNA helicase
MSLWDYQELDVEKVEGAKNPLYVLPTGGGKTVVAGAIIDRAVARVVCILVLTHPRDILLKTR